MNPYIPWAIIYKHEDNNDIKRVWVFWVWNPFVQIQQLLKVTGCYDDDDDDDDSVSQLYVTSVRL